MLAVLPDPWLALGADTLVEAMPASMQASDAGIEFAPDGQVIVGPEFRMLEAAWIQGLAGDRVIGMATSQEDVVHRGMVYDLEVDTAQAESMECARATAAHVSGCSSRVWTVWLGWWESARVN